MVNAYVVSPKSAEAIGRRIAALKSVKSGQSCPRTSETEEPVPSLSPLVEAIVRCVLREQIAPMQRRFDSLSSSLEKLASLAPRLDLMEEGFRRRMDSFEESIRSAGAKIPVKPKAARPEEPFTRQSLSKTTLAVLKEIAKEKDVDCKGLKKKQEFIESILKYVNGGT